MAEHVIWKQSASSGARSMACPGWSALTYYHREQFTKERDTPWSQWGDDAHLLLENSLRDKNIKGATEAIERLQDTDDKERHFASIAFAVKYLKKQIKKHPGKLHLETYIEIFPQYEFNGHVDIRIVAVHQRTLFIYDYKHGSGVPVYVDGNWQAIGYAIGSLEELSKKQKHKIDKVVCTIIQPRCTQVKPVQSISYTRKQMDKLSRKLQKGVATTNSILRQTQVNNVKPSKRHLNRGDKQCQFCPVKPVCPKWYKPAAKVVKQYRKDTDGNPNAYADMSQRKLERLVMDAQGIEKYLASVRGQVEAQIATGRGVGLVKPVPGDLRTYTSKDAIDQLDKARKKGTITKKQYRECLKTGLATLAVLRQNLPPKLVKRITRQTRNRSTLVPSTDKRKSSVELAREKFNGKG